RQTKITKKTQEKIYEEIDNIINTVLKEDFEVITVADKNESDMLLEKAKKYFNHINITFNYDI
ncbi:MAG: hypothetical protein ACFFD1_14470, partial [Candidatus Thorarchaeota archaeon]